jgi:hypothetical protein
MREQIAIYLHASICLDVWVIKNGAECPCCLELADGVLNVIQGISAPERNASIIDNLLDLDYGQYNA